jgi:hypothetical protein
VNEVGDRARDRGIQAKARKLIVQLVGLVEDFHDAEFAAIVQPAREDAGIAQDVILRRRCAVERRVDQLGGTAGRECAAHLRQVGAPEARVTARN